MPRTTDKILVFSFFLSLIFLVLFILYLLPSQLVQNEKDYNISIASWNVQRFGEEKAKNNTLVREYLERISKYDFIILQEVIDINGTSFNMLCNKLPDYECFRSSPAGRTRYKETYGILFNKSKIRINNVMDFNPDILDRWERPPFAINISKIGAKNDEWIVIYTIHIKPSDAKNEIRNLERLIGNVTYPAIIIGDLNADCSFYNTSEKEFKNWIWLIEDDEDTTVGKSDCAYDRIIVNKAFIQYYLNHGIDKNITPNLSDHYLIWILIH